MGMGSGVAREAYCPLVACERLALALVRSEEWWCIAKNNKAPHHNPEPINLDPEPISFHDSPIWENVNR